MGKRDDQSDRKPKRPASASSGTALQEDVEHEDNDMADVPATSHDRDRSLEHHPAPERQEAPRAESGFFDIYKPMQGYHTRVWTGVAVGALSCWFAYFLYEKFALVGEGHKTKYIQVAVAVAAVLILGFVAYWALARSRRICDFLIATEGEMKKVNWTNRQEIIGSTKVVIFVVIFMSILLFVVDVFFMLFFNSIGILKGGLGGVLKGLFG